MTGLPRPVFVGVAVALVVGVALAASSAGDDTVAAVLDAGVGVGLLVAAHAAWEPRFPRRHTVLLVATGLAWLAGSLWAPLLFVHRGPLVHLYLAYPTRWLRWPPTVTAIATTYALSVFEPLAGRVGIMLAVAGVTVTAATMTARRVSGTMRQAALIALAAAATFSTALAFGALNRQFGWRADRVALWIYDVVVLAGAVLLVVAARRARWGDSVVTSLVIDLGRPAEGTLRDALAGALSDPTVILGTWDDRQRRYVDDLGATVEVERLDADRAVTAIDVDGARAAVLVRDAAVPVDTALLESVTAVARLAVANSQMEVAARARVDELIASRRRLVETADEQRRQLSRELDDEVGSALDRVQALLGSAPDCRPLAAVRDQVATARSELEELARGIRPRLLAEGGLAAALPDLARRAGVAVEFDVAIARLPAAVESALYFVCAEALTNVAKHAAATSASIEVARRDGALIALIVDDGRGGADLRAGTGLRGIADRVEALGGRFEVDSEPGIGTRLVVEIPLPETSSRSIDAVIERVLSVETSFEAADETDRRYWWAQSPQARLAHVMRLRRLNYGRDRVAARLPRVLEVVRRERC